VLGHRDVTALQSRYTPLGVHDWSLLLENLQQSRRLLPTTCSEVVVSSDLARHPYFSIMEPAFSSRGIVSLVP